MTPQRTWNALRKVHAGLRFPAALRYVACHWLDFGRSAEFLLHPRGIFYPLIVRRGASDIHAFKSVFVDREYSCLDDLQNVRLVIDCGANVGYSSAYFLSIFPNCSVIAVEPDSGNFAILERNLSPYGERAKCIRAGIWSNSAPLSISQEKYRDGSQWSQQIRVCGPGEESEFQGLGVETLLDESGADQISLLKMDVEGAEAVIFSENYEGWLEKVGAIAIELHDDSTFGPASQVFFAAIEGRDFRISNSGELTICRQSNYI